MSLVATILVAAAEKVGAPLLKSILGRKIGTAGDGLVDLAIGKVAEKLGVEPDAIPDQPEKAIEKAVAAAEAEAPELLAAHLEQQKATHTFLSGEKPRPRWVDAWQWFLMGLWAFNGLAVTLANAAGAGLERLPWEHLVMLTLTYQGLNMGGHTALRLAREWKGKA